MGTMNRRYRVPDMDKLTLSAAALAVLPEVADFLEETGKDLRYKKDREGFAHAAEQLRIEHAEPTGDYLARVASGKTRGDLDGAVPARPGEWPTAADIPGHVGQVRDVFGRMWTKQFLPNEDGSPQWRLPGARFGGPLPTDAFPVVGVD
jgi:hypothetical protein